MKKTDVKWLLLAGLGVGAGVLAYKGYKSLADLFGKAKDTASQALTSAQDDVADALTKWFGPSLSQAAQETTYFIVLFDENGAQHAVPASTVNAQGQFLFANPPSSSRTYQLYLDQDGKKHARAI